MRVKNFTLVEITCNKSCCTEVKGELGLVVQYLKPNSIDNASGVAGYDIFFVNKQFQISRYDIFYGDEITPIEENL